METPSILVAIVTILSVIFFQHALANKPPEFVNWNGQFQVREDQPVDSVLFQISAKDDDLTPGSNLLFSVEGEIANKLLNIVQTSPTTANVVLKSGLDRETTAKYDLVFFVSDTLSRVSASLLLTVTDVNDNAPRFDLNTKFSLDVKEDTAPNTVIYTIKATDPDEGYGGTILYELSVKSEPGQPTDIFSIDRGNGDVKLLKKLDYEATKIYQLDITAKDGDGLKSTTVLVIYVKDVQDTPPRFFSTPYAASVPENAPLNTEILQLFAQDGDVQKGVANNVTFKFKTGTNKYFNLDAETGKITLKVKLNREDPELTATDGLIQFEVTASEDTTNKVGETEVTTNVRITVTDVNDETPTFNAASYKATVLENTQKDIPITLVPADSEITVLDKDKGDNGKFKLEIRKDGALFAGFAPSPSGTIFNQATVLIRVKDSSVLDFEKTKQIKLQLVATETDTAEKKFSVAELTVDVLDVNDHFPEFDKQTYSATIAENAPKGTRVATITATDGDQGTFGDLTYKLKGSNSDKFAVNAKTGVITTAKEADKDTKILDRETVDTYYLSYEAVDGGNYRVTTSLEIHLSDKNDNKPEFTRSQYEGLVKEGQDKLERAVTVEARDRDLGVNKQIVYSITGGDPGKNFTIHADTGVIGLTGVLDFEKLKADQKGKFTLTVEAKDKGTPPLADTVQVIITMEDVNDNRPYFNATKFTASVPEDAKAGTSVSRVTAKDDDLSGSGNSQLIYRIEAGALDKFRINGQTGLVTVETGANLDRDRYQKKYSLRVVAIDRGTTSLTGTTTIEVSVTDVNNKIPTFNPDSTRINVIENKKVNDVVHTYAAADLDEDASLAYSLLTDQTTAQDENGKPVDAAKYNFKDLFGIKPATGQVFVKKPLDRERAAEITLKIRVTDTKAVDPKPQVATATLTININDVNDNPPEFVGAPNNHYSGSVSEGTQPGVQIVRIVAVDKDKGTTVKYRIKSDPSKSVEIKNENDGVVTLKKTLDREAGEWLNFTVEAFDSGATSQSSVATVALQIKDVNDNSPTFEAHPATLNLAENTEINKLVMTLTAKDPDTGSFASILYSITQAPADGTFGINQKNGGLRVVKALDREKQATYTLVITAADNNGVKTDDADPRTTDTKVVVTVLDINDNKPKFGADKFKKNIQETAVVNDVIAPYSASDPDEGKNAEITYSFNAAKSNGTALFNINSKTGEVSPKVQLSEHIGCYLLTLVAKDAGTPSLSGTCELVLCVVDLNNNPPKITRPDNDNTTFLITEGSAIGTKITTIVATDSDQGPTNKITFSFAKNLADQKKYWEEFNIDPKTGEITTKTETDHERIPVYYLQVIANDTQFDARRDIKIKVLDVDDNPPLFSRDGSVKIPFPMVAPEEAVPKDGGYIGTIPSANDPDAAANAAICYYIVGGDDPDMAFRLDRVTRKLYLTKKLDRETLAKDYIDLVIKAQKVCDDGWDRTKVLKRQKRADTTVVDRKQFEQPYKEDDRSLMLIRVTVQDINDSPPVWRYKVFNAGVTKDTQIYSQIFQFAMYVKDNDTGLNNVTKFYISGDIDVTPTKLKQQVEEKLSSHDVFKVKADTGVMITNMFFEAGMNGYFSFEIKVNDSAGHSDTARVMVYLLSDDQRVKVVFREPIGKMGEKRESFAQFLSGVIPNAKVIVDKIATHKTKAGLSNDKLTDMFIHAVNNETGKILSAREVLDLIDQNYDNLETFFKDHNVIQAVLAVEPVSGSEEQVSWLRLALIVTAVVLGVLLLFLIIILLCCRKKYRRKLKAATAMAFGPMEGHLNKVDMPGTNLHAYEGPLSPHHARVRNSLALVTDDSYKYFSCGENVLPRSNPIWMETYQNQWHPEEDVTSKNSLDENALDPNVNKVFDEQEITLDLYNDEYDNYNKLPHEAQNGGFINAALEEHENSKNDKTQNGVNNNTPDSKRAMNGKGTFGKGDSKPLGRLETTEI